MLLMTDSEKKEKGVIDKIVRKARKKDIFNIHVCCVS